jgi:hypothetical protein
MDYEFLKLNGFKIFVWVCLIFTNVFQFHLLWFFLSLNSPPILLIVVYFNRHCFYLKKNCILIGFFLLNFILTIFYWISWELGFLIESGFHKLWLLDIKPCLRDSPDLVVFFLFLNWCFSILFFSGFFLLIFLRFDSIRLALNNFFLFHPLSFFNP